MVKSQDICTLEKLDIYTVDTSVERSYIDIYTVEELDIYAVDISV